MNLRRNWERGAQFVGNYVWLSECMLTERETLTRRGVYSTTKSKQVGSDRKNYQNPETGKVRDTQYGGGIALGEI